MVATATKGCQESSPHLVEGPQVAPYTAGTNPSFEARLMEQGNRILPLFPLSAVLFPDAAIPLRIFEDRYKLMLQRCLESDSEFGVVLIKSGFEVGGPAETYSVGTVARIFDVERRDDADRRRRARAFPNRLHHPAAPLLGGPGDNAGGGSWRGSLPG